VSQTSDAVDESLMQPLMIVNHRSMVEMQRNVEKQGKRNGFIRFILAKGDKDKIAAWNQELFRLLHVFNVSSIGSIDDPRT
jgi:hypothetical protein